MVLHIFPFLGCWVSTFGNFPILPWCQKKISSNSSSIDTRISVDLYRDSLDSRISLEDYNSLMHELKLDGEISEREEMLIETGVFEIPKPMRFKRVPCRVSSKRLEFLTSEHQLLWDVAKKCCLLECLPKIVKKGLKLIRHWYLYLNGEEQDIFLADRLQLVQDSSSRSMVSFGYYINVYNRCCRTAFKIAFRIGNM